MSSRHLECCKKGDGAAILLNDSLQCKKKLFFDDFVELLSLICIDFDGVVIVGDLNTHVDNPLDRGTNEL